MGDGWDACQNADETKNERSYRQYAKQALQVAAEQAFFRHAADAYVGESDNPSI
ncbi:MAG: hypothetical protein AB4050_14285 [Synechococcus sp.]